MMTMKNLVATLYASFFLFRESSQHKYSIFTDCYTYVPIVKKWWKKYQKSRFCPSVTTSTVKLDAQTRVNIWDGFNYLMRKK